MFKIEAKYRTYLPFSDSADEKKWIRPFFFIQGADTQFGMKEKSMGKKNPGSDPEIVWSTQMVKDINAMNPPPRFVVVCGDLLDGFPQSEPVPREEQREEFNRVFVNLKVPLVCVCGNHDVGDQPTYESVASYKSSFGDDFFSYWCGGVFFIVLNSQYFEDDSLIPDLSKEQNIWLDEQLKTAKELTPEHVVVFQHIPFFLRHPTEADEYFNIDLKLRTELLQKLYSSGVRYVFTGHYHRNAGGFYRDMELIVTSAVGMQLGDDMNGYRIVKVEKDKIQHKYFALGTAPTNNLP